jgi:hypothetical protein
MEASMSVVRMAFFEGALKPGREVEFHAYAREKLVPLWTSFPNLRAFRMLTEGTTDDGAYSFVLVLEFAYDSREAMAETMASPIRMQSREVTKGLFEFFDGRISHRVFDAADLSPAKGD